MRSLPRPIRPLLLPLGGLLGLVGLLGALEMAHRLLRYRTLAAPRETFVADPAYGYGYNPRDSAFPGGFRGGMPAGPKAPDEARILCLGESITSGEFIARTGDTWPGVLERRLAAVRPEARARVWNGAIGGHGTRHTVALLRRRLREVAPDLVLIYAGSVGNGLEEGELWTPFPVPGAADPPLVALDKLLYRSCTLYRVRLRHHLKPFLPAPPVDAYGWDRLYAGVPEDIAEAAMEARRAGARAVVIQYPTWRRQGVRHRGQALMDSVEALQERVGAAAAAAGARVLDMRGLLPGADEARNPFFTDWRHLNREGCRRFGEALADSLLRLELL